jgi:cyanophycin synthetase
MRPLQLGRTTLRQTSDSSADKAVKTAAPFEFAIAQVFKGPSIYAPRAAVRCEVTVNPEWLGSDGMSESVRRLLDVLPELGNAISAQSSNVNWANKALYNRTRLADLLAIATYALMRRIDEWISPITSRPLEEASGFDLVCEYRRSPDNAKAAVQLALDILAPVRNESELSGELARFERVRRWHENIANPYILEEAELRGIPVFPLDAGPPLLGTGCRQKRLRGTMTSATGYLAARMADNKIQTARVLKLIGLPFPEQISVGSKKDALRAAKRIGYPVVVKPVNSSGGRGVSAKVVTDSGVERAYEQAALISRQVLIERHIVGLDFRLLVVDGELVAASQRIHGRVVGNGKDTVKQLLATFNADPRRDERFMHKIKIDYDMQRMLEDQGLTLESIPDDGLIVPLRSKADASDIALGLTERVHPDNRLLAIAATRALQLDVAGIDFVTTDISRSYKETGGAICEVNSFPSIIELHVSPSGGAPVHVAPYILDMLFPPPSQGRIPIIAICGNSFDDRLSHSIAHLLQLAGHEVGLVTQAGLWVSGDQISQEDSANFEGARRVLLHPSVSVAVIEVPMDSLLNEGLGFDFADVAVLTSNFLKPPRGEEQARNATALVQSVAGSLVVEGETPAPHMAEAEQKKIHFVNHATTPDERVIGTTIAACHAIGISADVIEDGLKTGPDARQSDPLLISRLATPLGNVLMATPRTGTEVEALSEIARSWAAPQSPDIVIHMSFEGDPDLRAALDTLTQIGSARVLRVERNGHAEPDLLPLLVKGSEKKVLVLTDNMEFFRKGLRLGQPGASVAGHMIKDPGHAEQFRRSSGRIAGLQSFPRLSG